MKNSNLYVLDDAELLAIGDLCEGLGIAIDRIIRRRRLIREVQQTHPAIDGYQELVQATLFDDDEEDALMRLF